MSIKGNVDHVVINLPGSRPPPRRRRRIPAASAVAGTTAAVAVAVLLSGRGVPGDSGPVSLGQSAIATGLHANGDYGIFAIDRQEHLIHSVTSPAGEGRPWTAFGLEGTVAAITTAADSSQLLHVMAVMADGSVQQRSEETPGQWGHWQLFAPAGTASDLALGLDRHGYLNVFAVSPRGQLISRKQLVPGSDGWSGWTPVSLPGPVRSVTATRKANRYLDVLAVLANGAVEWEDEIWAGYRPWAQIGPAGTAVQASIGQSGGRLTVYALTPSGTISNTYQEAAYTPHVPNGHLWSAWVPNVQPCCTAASVDVGFDYPWGLTLLAVDTDGTLRSLSQSQPGGPWAGGWKILGPAGGFGPGSPPRGA